MIIHVTGSSRDAKEDLPYLRMIREVVENSDATLSNNWIDAAETSKGADFDALIKGELGAIHQADVVIVEATSDHLAQGYQIAVALQYKKPVLVITRNKLEEQFLSGIKDRLLTKAEYKNEAELAEVVKRFLRDNTISTKDLRFNMFIDRPIYNYLRTVSYETGKNKSEIIRELINNEIKKEN